MFIAGVDFKLLVLVRQPRKQTLRAQMGGDAISVPVYNPDSCNQCLGFFVVHHLRALISSTRFSSSVMPASKEKPVATRSQPW